MKNKIVVVTGGASGLGLGISHALLHKEATVVVFDYNKDSLAKLDPAFHAQHVDVTQYDQVQTAVDEVIAKFGKIDVLINNAGVIHSEPLINIMNPKGMKHSYDSFKKILDLDLNSVFIVGSIVAEKMVMKRIKGTIINISSISAEGNAGQTAYSAAKSAVNAITKVWSKELGIMGIRVNAIAPGFINTESTQHALNEKILENLKTNIPLRKLGQVDNIAKSVLFMIENDYVNGAILDVNGGLTI